MPKPSTFSIVGYDPQEQAWGVAVASKFLAVGSVVPWAQAGVGAVATQSYCNTSFGPEGLRRMAQGRPAEETLAELLAGDPERELRQVGLVDGSGGSATFTGSGCYDWAGGLAGANFAAQGNILTRGDVVQAMADTFLAEALQPLPRRLLNALLAGDLAGGDRRGRQSAALFVVKAGGGYGGFNDRWVDLRVDDDPAPVTRLQSLLELQELYFGSSPESERVDLQGEALRSLQKILARRGTYHGPADGVYSPAVREALEAFTGSENFEERTNFEQGWMDRPVFEYILRQFGETE